MGKRNIVWNDFISQNERFADFFNGTVFGGEKVVSPEALTALDTKLWRRRQEKLAQWRQFESCFVLR